MTYTRLVSSFKKMTETSWLCLGGKVVVCKEQMRDGVKEGLKQTRTSEFFRV